MAEEQQYDKHTSRAFGRKRLCDFFTFMVTYKHQVDGTAPCSSWWTKTKSEGALNIIVKSMFACTSISLGVLMSWRLHSWYSLSHTFFDEALLRPTQAESRSLGRTRSFRPPPSNLLPATIRRIANHRRRHRSYQYECYQELSKEIKCYIKRRLHERRIEAKKHNEEKKL